MTYVVNPIIEMDLRSIARSGHFVNRLVRVMRKLPNTPSLSLYWEAERQSNLIKITIDTESNQIKKWLSDLTCSNMSAIDKWWLDGRPTEKQIKRIAHCISVLTANTSEDELLAFLVG